MRRYSSLIWMLVLLGVGLFHAPQTHAARVQLCNETSHILMISFGIVGQNRARSYGWHRLLPGSCERPNIPYRRREKVFVHASSHKLHSGSRLLFEGQARFCVVSPPDKFDITEREDCFLRGHAAAGFSAVDLTARLPRVSFTTIEQYSTRRARVAGAQRLLLEADYDIGRIDGFASKRTMTALNQLRHSKKLPKRRLIYETDIRALLEEVEKLNAGRGLRLCNRTSSIIWAAIGFARADDFESQGWLKINPEQCHKAVNEKLQARYYFIYGESRLPKNPTLFGPLAEAPAPQRTIWGGDFTLCSKTTKFVITGRHDCEERGFISTKFLRLDTGRAIRWEYNFEATP